MPRWPGIRVLLIALAAATLHCKSEDSKGLPAPPAASASSPSSESGAPALASSPLETSAAPITSVTPGAPASVASAAQPAAPPGMLEIPAGVFLMGSRAEHGSPEERPMHEVVVASFYLDKTEVTTEAYVACMNAGACAKPYVAHPFCNIKKIDERGNHPINCVDYHQSAAYCAFAKKRLPTEREWEYAARGGAEQRRFSWGDEETNVEERACYMHRGSCPVASFAPGAFGLYDMSGGVWEWTSSWFGSYPDEAKKGRYRVYRGGSWSRRFPKWLVNSLRNRYRPEEWSASVGFRCAQSRTPLVCPKDTEAKDGVCVRVSGVPLCEPGYTWNGVDACTVRGVPSVKPRVGASSGHDGEASNGNRASDEPRDAAPAAPKATDPITQTRTPQFDGDCQKNWPKKPSAYKFSGATFHARNRPLEAAGCTRRDMGSTWTSACCPQ